MITLNVNSSLNVVGFLAHISSKIAEAEIPVNVVSAFYHDHLFIPVEKAYDALKLLKEIQNK